MTKLKAYFDQLPISFRSAAVATVVITLLVLLQSFFWVSKMDNPSHPWDSKHIILPILNYTIWLAIVPLLYTLIIKYVHQKEQKKSELRKRLFLLAIAFTIGHEIIGVLLYNLIYALSHMDEVIHGTMVFNIEIGVFGLSKTFFEFCILFFVLQSFHNKRKVKEIEVKNSKLESDLLKAQMSALKNQLHPHFLFNAFNTISSLMDENTILAQRMMSKLGALLRKILREGERPFITILEEVELAKLYLEVEQIRFKERLVTRFSIEPTIEEIMIPTLLLQPIIENAVKHGFYRKVGECEISIKICWSDGHLLFEVRDNGAGVKNDDAFSLGIGLKNTRERLKGFYAEDYELLVDPKPQNGGFCVQIKVSEEALKP